MSVYHKNLRFWVLIVCLTLGFGGCVSSPNPRMSEVLGLPVDKTSTQPLIRRWTERQAIGLVALSDATGPDAAPAISSSLLSRLTHRAEVYLSQHCRIPEIKIIPFNGDEAKRDPSTLIKRTRDHQVGSLIVALFSSMETTQPATFGEARMMTQMPGTTTHNSALVELGMIDITRGIVERQAYGEATESLDRLTVPIGNDQPTYEEALDILRANAGQQALDKALQGFTQGCVGI